MRRTNDTKELAMKEETEKRVRAIEEKLDEIDAQIARLQAERGIVLTSDEEYASYLVAYHNCYDDGPLSLRQYYEFSEELDDIGGQMDKADDEKFNELWNKYARRLAWLERRLAA